MEDNAAGFHEATANRIFGRLESVAVARILPSLLQRKRLVTPTSDPATKTEEQKVMSMFYGCQLARR